MSRQPPLGKGLYKVRSVDKKAPKPVIQFHIINDIITPILQEVALWRAQHGGGERLYSRPRRPRQQARTVEELRQDQAAMLSLEFGFPLEQVVMVIGISKG